ncbi:MULTISPECIES: F0F1 ATP synthase subunit C [Paracoccaceae]|uniref:F0F1 ATP synthase subunit C n=1 Tax=Paracoccaceae TaxID=31989 RepID=UPI0020201CAF|nr:F0F1 ATP synthase subunit C [Phaeovulum sp. NW3]MCL7463606.1 F0F1 ATP synthase subunit C [Phaeovulum sp. NW3]
MEGSISELGQYLGAGLACIGMAGAAVGVGNVAGNFLNGALRNPSAAAGQTATLFIGMAFAEALGIFSFLVALLLLFAV